MPFTYTNPHEQSYRSAQLEKTNLEQERLTLRERASWIDQRIAQLETYLQAIKPLLEDDPGGVLAQEGLTVVCRELLEKNPRWMGAGEIRVLLAQMGIDLKPYSNPMATLHSVLGRVGQKFRREDGTLYYSAPGVPAMGKFDVPPPSSVLANTLNLLEGTGGYQSKRALLKGRNMIAPPPGEEKK